MSVLRFLFVLVVLMLYGIMFTEQRMETREKTREITRLTQRLELMNARKQELITLIEIERARLVKESERMGVKLSPKDVVNVE